MSFPWTSHRKTRIETQPSLSLLSKGEITPQQEEAFRKMVANGKVTRSCFQNFLRSDKYDVLAAVNRVLEERFPEHVKPLKQIFYPWLQPGSSFDFRPVTDKSELRTLARNAFFWAEVNDIDVVELDRPYVGQFPGTPIHNFYQNGALPFREQRPDLEDVFLQLFGTGVWKHLRGQWENLPARRHRLIDSDVCTVLFSSLVEGVNEAMIFTLSGKPAFAQNARSFIELQTAGAPAISYKDGVVRVLSLPW